MMRTPTKTTPKRTPLLSNPASGQRQLRIRNERGYALLMVIFFVTLLLLTAMAAAPSILTEGRREQEKEMIWRGKQYARGVRLYYRKMGRFPTSIDDLTEPKLGSLRFMRQAYKDPMNKQDGSWRFIYVGPAGQLIGSLKPPQTLQFAPAGAGAAGIVAGGGPGTPALPGTGISTAAGQNPFGTPAQPGSAQPGGAASGANPSGTNPAGITGTPVSADQGDADSNPQAISTGETPTIIGGNIIGVGSKINRSSIIIYEHAKNYRLFEFIWDPSKDIFVVGQPGMQTGTGLGQPAGQNPLGQPAGQTPLGMPQNPPQNPPPQQPQ